MAEHQEQQYLDLLQEVLDKGRVKGDRTETGTISRTGAMMRFDLTGGEFPLFTTRKFNPYPIFKELDWFLEGSSNVWDLIRSGCNIWNSWMEEDKEFGENLKERPLVKVHPKEDRDLKAMFEGENLSVYYKGRMSLAGMVKKEFDEESGPMIDTILTYWSELMYGTMHYIDPEHPEFGQSPLLDRTGCVALDAELHTPLIFVRLVLGAPNFKNWIQSVVEGSVRTSRYHITSIYHGGSLISTDAMFLHHNEVVTYQSDTLYKVTFEKYPYGERPAMYLFSKTQMKTHIDDLTAVESITKVKKLPKGMLLRHTTKSGELGPVYGKQWRRQLAVRPDGDQFVAFEHDQIADVMDKLKNNPEGRRIIVDCWNPGEVPNMKLPPCHLYFQFVAAPIKPHEARRILSKITDEVPDELPKFILDLDYLMRSNDLPVGQPFNTASYAALLLKMCAVMNMVPGDLVYQGVDTHIYQNQISQVKKMIKRKPKPLPKVKVLNWGAENLEDVELRIEGYEHHPQIKMPVAV
tara:strand:- start:3545 stop:5104 length:1560 start_codon:yes stop_codon:yes gene_type:complete